MEPAQLFGKVVRPGKSWTCDSLTDCIDNRRLMPHAVGVELGPEGKFKLQLTLLTTSNWRQSVDQY